MVMIEKFLTPKYLSKVRSFSSPRDVCVYFVIVYFFLCDSTQHEISSNICFISVYNIVDVVIDLVYSSIPLLFTSVTRELRKNC